MIPWSYIVITGNPSSGFEHYGPFDDERAAAHFADEGDFDNWWVVALIPPTEVSDES